MTKLLVSVRSAREARQSLQAGVQLIDIKEPGRGSLGAVDASTVAEIIAAVSGRVPVSVALGELEDERAGLFPCLDGTIGFAKIGLSGCAHRRGWQDRWISWAKSLPAGVVPVAVAYADWRYAQSARPAEIVQQAVSAGFGAILWDTYDKSQGDLFAHCDGQELERLVTWWRGQGLLAVLGGSLTVATIPCALALGPDYVAVRGAVCRGDRTQELDGELVGQLVDLVTGASQRNAIKQ